MAKVLVSFDEQVLARLDREAEKAGLSRSAYLQRLAMAESGVGRGSGSGTRAHRALSSLDRLFRENTLSGDSTSAIRADRDSR